MRRGEVLGLSWRNVDFDAARLVVDQQILSVEYEARAADVKTTNSRRTIDLDPRTVAVLRAWRRHQLEQTMSTGHRGDDEFVPTRPDGGPIHPDLFSQSRDRLMRGREIRRIRLTHVTILLKAAVTVKVVSGRLRHSSPAFTMTVYQHVLPGMQGDAAAACGDAVIGVVRLRFAPDASSYVVNTVRTSNAGSEDRQRALGAYYSPEPIARLLVRWALRGRPGRVLDPSYGGCAFLRVAIDELTALATAEQAKVSVFGADIDGSTASWAAHLVSQGVPAENLRSADFLSLKAGQDLPKVEAVVGNPPYVRHHWLAEATKRSVAAIADEAGVPLSKRASVWAAFVIHSCQFVAPGGRLTFLLPGSILYADYAREVRSYLSASFEHVRFVRLTDRLFNDANEETVVLLATGARVPAPNVYSSDIIVQTVSGLSDLESALRHGDDAVDSLSRSELSAFPEWKVQQLSNQAQDTVARFLDNSHVHLLSDVARVSLGCVTGANDFFILTDQQLQQMQVGDSTVPIVTRNAWLTGPCLSAHSFLAASLGNPRHLLSLPATTRIDGRSLLGRHLRLGIERGIPDRRHCRRNPWWSIRIEDLPDAFFPYTVGTWRGLALNTTGATSTNTVHQVRWLTATSTTEARSRALVSWSSLAQLCAELIGRRLGGGVLKLELGDAARMPTMSSLTPDDEVLSLARRDETSARRAADDLLAQSGLRLTEAEIKSVQDATSRLARGGTSTSGEGTASTARNNNLGGG